MKKTLLLILSCFCAIGILQAQYVTKGDASQDNTPCGSADCFTLTPGPGDNPNGGNPDGTWQSGAVWSQVKLDLRFPFTICYDAYFGDRDTSGADGMAFVLQNSHQGTNALGGTGGFLGLGDPDTNNPADPGQRIYPSVAIEMDTWNNNGQFNIDDIDPDHFSVIRDGDLTNPDTIVPANPDGSNIEDDRCHSICISWNPESKMLRVEHDGHTSLVHHIDLLQAFQGRHNVTWGITGATGAMTNLQTACITHVSNPKFTYNEDASSSTNGPCGTDCHELTPDLPGKHGSMMGTTRIDLNNYFEIRAHLYFGYGINGADGIAFLFHNDPAGDKAIGLGGGSIGYEDISPSIAVEMDSWENPWDGSANHMSLNFDGKVNMHTKTKEIWYFEDGSCHEFRAIWNPVDSSFKVEFEGNPALDTTINLIDSVFNGDSLVFWGFTASTGANYNEHIVCIDSIIMTPAPTFIAHKQSNPNAISSGQQPKHIECELKLVPNPANYSTEVLFTLEEASTIKLNVFDITGRKVIQQQSHYLDGGEQRLQIDTEDLEDGVYLILLSAPGHTSSGKLIIQK